MHAKTLQSLFALLVIIALSAFTHAEYITMDECFDGVCDYVWESAATVAAEIVPEAVKITSGGSSSNSYGVFTPIIWLWHMKPSLMVTNALLLIIVGFICSLKGIDPHQVRRAQQAIAAAELERDQLVAAKEQADEQIAILAQEKAANKARYDAKIADFEAQRKRADTNACRMKAEIEDLTTHDIKHYKNTAEGYKAKWITATTGEPYRIEAAVAEAQKKLDTLQDEVAEKDAEIQQRDKRIERLEEELNTCKAKNTSGDQMLARSKGALKTKNLELSELKKTQELLKQDAEKKQGEHQKELAARDKQIASFNNIKELLCLMSEEPGHSLLVAVNFAWTLFENGIDLEEMNIDRQRLDILYPYVQSGQNPNQAIIPELGFRLGKFKHPFVGLLHDRQMSSLAAKQTLKENEWLKMRNQILENHLVNESQYLQQQPLMITNGSTNTFCASSALFNNDQLQQPTAPAQTDAPHLDVFGMPVNWDVYWGRAPAQSNHLGGASGTNNSANQQQPTTHFFGNQTQNTGASTGQPQTTGAFTNQTQTSNVFSGQTQGNDTPAGVSHTQMSNIFGLKGATSSGVSQIQTSSLFGGQAQGAGASTGASQTNNIFGNQTATGAFTGPTQSQFAGLSSNTFATKETSKKAQTLEEMIQECADNAAKKKAAAAPTTQAPTFNLFGAGVVRKTKEQLDAETAAKAQEFNNSGTKNVFGIPTGTPKNLFTTPASNVFGASTSGNNTPNVSIFSQGRPSFPANGPVGRPAWFGGAGASTTPKALPKSQQGAGGSWRGRNRDDSDLY